MNAVGTEFPPTFPECEGVRRYRSPAGRVIANVAPGQFYVSRSDEEDIVTVLGSCVSACIRDPIARIGGINHFMLPLSGTDTDRASPYGSASNRFGNVAMESLINTILKGGGLKARLEVKVFGGGRVLDLSADVGRRNVEFVRDYLKEEGLRVVAHDVLGPYPRKLSYNAITGVVRMKRLAQATSDVVRSELSYIKQMSVQAPAAGDIDFF